MKCFVISPIGEDGSEIRMHADEVYSHIIEPALSNFGIEAIRSDRMNEPGKISDQMYRAIFEYDLCIAVLTYANPNVYYELAVAQSASRPVVILIEKGSTLPFDVKDFRSLSYDLRITSYKERVHINRLIKVIEELKQNGWKGDDVFRAYRTQRTLPPSTDIHSYGIEITDPVEKAEVHIIDVHGTFQQIPPGHELRTLRYYPRQNSFVPHGSVALDRSKKTWRVSGFDVGGESGDERGIDIALVGPHAKIFLDYWIEANRAHWEVQSSLQAAIGKYGRWLPAITTWPDDLATCYRVLVKRK